VNILNYNREKDMRKKILIGILIVLIIIVIIAFFVIGNYFYNIALNPHTSKTFVLGEEQEKTEEQIDNEKWIKENSEDVYITSKNNGNLKLHGYESKNESNIWTIVIHGYMSEGLDMGGISRNFYDRGYNVLTLDLRGLGKSEGDYIGMGWHDRLDVLDWINYIIEKDSNCKIILYGISMGAATVMMTTGENLPGNVKLAIEDCGYTSVWDEFKCQLKNIFKLPSFPVLNAANTVCSLKAKYDFKEASSINQLKKSKTPTLFIHGSEDKFVPFSMLDEVYNVASCKKEKLVIEGAKHGKAGVENPKLYWETIDNFIKENI